ncbi:serine/threonine protein kinase [Rhodococcus antarcticus]|uniref:non-specific serine/threonine protein kinase n=1 Tax=Rhodococcus antarcticus TaxID=2987751 RepID=A0ABY6P3E0_9NOCA|nr:RIO1 family regulatory kinase/ATPase [Rhodococcus antarcticus]UZJ25796.1 serine/threonine protein kinase [Rhodococcus antarcticus]
MPHDIPGPRRSRPGRFDDDPTPRSRRRAPAVWDATDAPVPGGPTPSTWPDAVHGPVPRPGWLVTDAAATDTELGVLKTGKEADVNLIERAVPGGPSCLLAAKRYRSPEHRLFHRDAGYTEGRRVRRSRETRAMAHRTEFGRQLLAGQWAAAEFAALTRLTELGAPVPYPVQLLGTEVLLEYLDEPDGSAAPRLAQLRLDRAHLARLWHQLVDVLGLLADEGLAHGDLSPYNLLVHRGDLVVIDLPQVVDVVANPRGAEIARRDVTVMCTWFTSRGLVQDPDDVLAVLGRP